MMVLMKIVRSLEKVVSNRHDLDEIKNIEL